MKFTHPYFKELLNAASDIRPNTAVILGSGLGSFTEKMDIIKSVAYDRIRDFPKVTVEGHHGEMVHGTLAGRSILAARGRFHYYEGYSIEEVLTLVEFFKALDVSNLIITNAAGLINTSRQVGDIFFIRDCMDITQQAASAGDISLALSGEEDRQLAFKAAENAGMDLASGVYAWTTGPSYETPAEIKYLSSKGADLVGMSTMPEIIYARTLGIRVLPFSCATNLAAGISSSKLNHQEVFDVAEKVKEKLSSYVTEIIKLL